jgi:hypothetical protein
MVFLFPQRGQACQSLQEPPKGIRAVFLLIPENPIFLLINQLVKDDPPLYFTAPFRYYKTSIEIVLSPQLFKKKFNQT